MSKLPIQNLAKHIVIKFTISDLYLNFINVGYAMLAKTYYYQIFKKFQCWLSNGFCLIN